MDEAVVIAVVNETTTEFRFESPRIVSQLFGSGRALLTLYDAAGVRRRVIHFRQAEMIDVKVPE